MRWPGLCFLTVSHRGDFSTLPRSVWQSLEAVLVIRTGGRESSCHCVSVGHNSRDYECLPLSGNSCRQSTVNHRPYGTDHKYCRSSAGEMSPLIGGGREGLIKTSVRQILKDWISDIVVLFVYLLMYYRSLSTKVEALWGQRS